MTAPAAAQGYSSTGGFQIVLRRGDRMVDLTWFRGVPTQFDSFTFADPFGAQQAHLTFAAVSYFDRLGSGDLWWATKDTDVDIVFTGELPGGYPYSRWVFEGYVESPERGQQGLGLVIKGAMQQVDNHLAKPEYPTQPLTYEAAIAKQFSSDASLRLAPLSVTFPEGWDVFYTPAASDPLYLTPTGVTPNRPWTGLVTRNTGAWDKALSSYIQGLLATMWTKHGRFTLDLLPGRVPALYHLPFIDEPQADTLTVDLAAPGVVANLAEDWSQSVNTWFGQGKGLTGDSYSGQQVTTDGQATTYTPFAALRQVDPADESNAWFDPTVMRREGLLQLQDGLSDAQARAVAVDHLAMTAAPGVTGTIELQSDVLFGGVAMSRFLIRPGMTVQCPGYNGSPSGVLLHVSQVDATLGEDVTVTLTVDSLYRDALTLAEVALRGRDALNVQRSLIGGQYAPPVPDELMPWSYAEGSGFMPAGPSWTCQPLFADVDPTIAFPYTEITQARPPRDRAWTHSYMHIPAASHTDADKNWAVEPTRISGSPCGFPIKMAQAGTIRLVELAAYDKNGDVLAVPFHFSLYYTAEINVDNMPTLTGPKAADPSVAGSVADPVGITARYNKANGTDYAATQHNPFFDGAWETYDLSGTEIQSADSTSSGSRIPVSSAKLIRGWGTGIVKAGFWPGSQALGDAPTGLLRDETTWQFDTTGSGGSDTTAINPYQVDQTNLFAGYVFAMIYCDAQTEDVYFMGRMFIEPPGSATS